MGDAFLLAVANLTATLLNHVIIHPPRESARLLNRNAKYAPKHQALSAEFRSFTSYLVRRDASQHEAADLLVQGLPDLQDALVRGDEHALAHLEAVDVAALEPPGDPPQPRQLEVDGPAGLADAGDVAHDGLVVHVLEAHPQPPRRDVMRGHGLRHRRQELLGRRRLRPRARHARHEARPVQREEEEEVVLRVGQGRQAQPCAGRVLQVGAGVGYVEDAHLRSVGLAMVVVVGVVVVEEKEEETRRGSALPG